MTQDEQPTPRTDALISSQDQRRAIYFPLRLNEMTALARQLERELSSARAEVERLREALTVHLSHYSTDGYRIPTDEFMREVVKESRAALAATRKENEHG